jgi:hypothetical protein
MEGSALGAVCMVVLGWGFMVVSSVMSVLIVVVMGS